MPMNQLGKEKNLSKHPLLKYILRIHNFSDPSKFNELFRLTDLEVDFNESGKFIGPSKNYEIQSNVYNNSTEFCTENEQWLFQIQMVYIHKKTDSYYMYELAFEINTAKEFIIANLFSKLMPIDKKPKVGKCNICEKETTK